MSQISINNMNPINKKKDIRVTLPFFWEYLPYSNLVQR
jgi:hypothetical protein